MSARAHYFRVGLFVLTSAILLIGGLFAVGLKAYFGEHEIFETYVTGQVENLSIGALVKLRGVTIGKVRAIEFVGREYPEYKERYVAIHFEIPRGTVWSAETNNVQALLDAEAARGLRARVQGQGFLGAGIVSLEYVDPKQYPVEPIPWKPKHYYIPSAPSQINTVMASLERTMPRLEQVDLADLQERASRLMQVAESAVRHVDEVDFKQLSTNANSLLVDLLDTSRHVQRTLSDAQNAINGADLPALSRDADALISRLSNLSQELRHILAGVDPEELNSSLANVRAATDELVVLIQKLEQQPSAVLFSKSPKPVSEMGKPPKK